VSATARWIVTIVLLALATGAAVAGCFGVWAKRQALETDPWVDTSERVLKNEEVRDELGRELSTRVFQIPAVEQQTAALSPDQTRELKKTVREKAPEVLGSKPALRAWRTANRRAHELLLQFLDDKRDTVSINLRALLEEVAVAAGLDKDLVDRIPRNVSNLQVVSRGELQSARKGADVLRALAIILPLLAIALFVAAVLVAPKRLWALAATGGCLVFAALTVLVVRRIGRGVVVDQLADTSQAKPAVQATWSIATSLLVTVAIVALVAGVLLALLAVAVHLIRTPREDWDARTEVMPPRAAP
jgi:hypothetical protein